jgi:tetratricopeptide (TPR) repeat protein
MAHLSTAVLLVAALAAAAPIRAADDPPSIDALYLAFIKGDPGIVARTLVTPDDFARVRADLFKAVGLRQGDWRPTHEAFLFEVAMTGIARHWPDARMLLDASRRLMVGRRDPIGANPDIDRFEVTFHEAAVALLAGAAGAGAAGNYLDAIAQRLPPAPGEPPATTPRLDAPRLVLMRAIVQEMTTLPFTRAAVASDPRPYLWMAAPRDGELRRALERAVALFDAAATNPATADEAQVRAAFVLARLGRVPDALARLDRVSAGADPTVRYWMALVRGRALDAQGETTAAIAAYERAAALQPRAQTPAAALAALSLRAGDRDRALHWADVARTTPADVVDPWWQYFTGDFRLLAGWVRDLREARP